MTDAGLVHCPCDRNLACRGDAERDAEEPYLFAQHAAAAFLRTFEQCPVESNRGCAPSKVWWGDGLRGCSSMLDRSLKA